MRYLTKNTMMTHGWITWFLLKSDMSLPLAKKEASIVALTQKLSDHGSWAIPCRDMPEGWQCNVYRKHTYHSDTAILRQGQKLWRTAQAISILQPQILNASV